MALLSGAMKKQKVRIKLETLNKMGLGCWGLGGDAYGYITTSEAISLLDRAYSYGVRFFDLSNLYGAGRAEVIFGEWMMSLEASKRETISFVSKAGLLPHSSFEMPTDFDINSLRIEIQRSCKRLGIQKLPIFLLHSPSSEQLTQLNLEHLSNSLKAEALIDEFGVSFRAPGDLALINLQYIDWAELNINLMDMRINTDKKLISSLYEKNVRIIARTPLAFGFLTQGGVSDSDIKSPLSHLRNWDTDQIAVWRKGATEFAKYADKLKLSINELALSFCASLEFVDKVIPGAMTKMHVDKNYSRLVNLTHSEQNTLLEIYNKNIFYVQKKLS